MSEGMGNLGVGVCVQENVGGRSCAFQLVNPTVGKCGLQGAEWAGPCPLE